MFEQLTSIAVNLASTLGAIEIGLLISIFLFGMVTVQTFAYYKKFPNDRWFLKAFVCFSVSLFIEWKFEAHKYQVGTIWGLELVHAFMTTHAFYFYSIMSYGDPKTLLGLESTLDIAIIVSGVIGPAVQAFFVHRIRRLSLKWLFPSIMWLLCLLRCIGVMALAGVYYGTHDLPATKRKWLWLSIIPLAISAVNDVLITISLCYYLWRHRDTTLARTKTVLDKLIVWTIQTGLVTSCATTTKLILFLARDDYAWVAIFFIHSRLFSNSLMASLNARGNLRCLDEPSSLKVNSSLNFGLQSTHPTEINITMTSTTEQSNTNVELRKPME